MAPPPGPNEAAGGAAITAEDTPGRRNQRRFRVLWGGMIALILGGLSISAASEFDSARSTAERAVADSALILKQHMLRHFEGADLILRHAASEVAGHGWDGLDEGQEDVDFESLAQDTSWVGGLWLLDAEGVERFASVPPEDAVRDALGELVERAATAPAGLMVGDPVAGAFTAGSTFLVGRPIRDGAGRHLGVAALAVPGGDLADVFSHQVLGRNGAMGLIRVDGVVLARYPAIAGIVGRSIVDTPVFDEIRRGADSGTLRVDSVSDGRDRVVSFARIGNLPLAVTAAYAVRDMRAEALAAMKLQWAFGGLVLVVLLALYPIMMRRLRFEEQATRELAERELLFRSILNNVGVGIALVSRDGSIRFANTGFDRLLNYPPGGLTGVNVEDLTHPDDRLGTMYRISRMEAIGPAGLTYEKRYLRRDGSPVDAMISLSLKPRMGDQEPLLVGVVQDLTERRVREKAIAFQNSLLRIQQEASPDGLLVADAAGRIRSCNRRFRALWEVPESLLEDGDAAAVLRHVGSRIAVGAGEEAPVSDEAGWTRLRLTDGRTVDALESELRDGAGSLIGRVWFHRDVSARLAAEAAVRESESRYRALVEQSPEAIIVHADDRVLFINRAAQSLFGYGPGDWPADMAITDLVAPPVRDGVREAIRSTAESPWNGIQEDLQRRDGSLFDAWIISAPIRLHDRPAAQAVIRPLDTGAGVRGRLMQTAKMATLGQMAAGVAHELSQPLNILSMGLEGLRMRLAKGEVAAAEMGEKLEMATRQCGRMGEIIDHIRVFSRSSKGRQVAFDAAGPVAAAVDMMRPAFVREDMDLVVDMPDRAGVLEGSPLDLEQVVINLLKNALDALLERRAEGAVEAGWRPEVRLRVTAEPETPQLLIEVADNGPGVPRHLLQDIFEPFFTTKREGVGTGLGLSICMNAVTKMGGTLRVENRGGAVFSIRLPLAGPGTEATAAGVVLGLGGGGGAGRPAPGVPSGHVLLVEDDPLARQALAVFLIEQGFRVSTAADASEAAAKARLDPPDALVTDLHLPGGDDGAMLIRRLRERQPGLPALLVTGAAIGPDDPLAAEATAVLLKPVRARAVVEHLVRGLSDRAQAGPVEA